MGCLFSCINIFFKHPFVTSLAGGIVGGLIAWLAASWTLKKSMAHSTDQLRIQLETERKQKEKSLLLAIKNELEYNLEIFERKTFDRNTILETQTLAFENSFSVSIPEEIKQNIHKIYSRIYSYKKPIEVFQGSGDAAINKNTFTDEIKKDSKKCIEEIGTYLDKNF